MPVVPFESLPDASRVWVFGSNAPLSPDAEKALLRGVDEHLDSWKAHGEPLTVSREWRDGRFLVIGVDQSTAGATGCSIDGLFRVLQKLEAEIGASLVGGGRVFYRDGNGAVQSTDRAELNALAKEGTVSKDTVIFDTSLTDLGAWRSGFEKRAKESWAAELLPATAD